MAIRTTIIRFCPTTITKSFKILRVCSQQSRSAKKSSCAIEHHLASSLRIRTSPFWVQAKELQCHHKNSKVLTKRLAAAAAAVLSMKKSLTFWGEPKASKEGKASQSIKADLSTFPLQAFCCLSGLSETDKSQSITAAISSNSATEIFLLPK